MNTILNTGTVAAAALVALLTPAAGAAGPAPGANPLTAQGVAQECRQSPTLVEAWVRDGEPLPPCVINHNLMAHRFGDDRRPQR